MSRTKWVVFGLAVVCLLGRLVLLPCTGKVRNGEGWAESAASLRQIGQSLLSYHEANGKLPPAVARDQDGKPLYSWRVLLLPYLEQGLLYDRFQLDEPWDGPHNKALLEETPRCYEPMLGGKDAPGLTRYQVFVGPGTAFERDGLTWDDFPDGRENTILVVEAGGPVPWTKPVDLPYDPDQPLPLLGDVYAKPYHFLCYEMGRTPGLNACFADGTTRFLSGKTDEKVIRGLITRNGGEKVDASAVALP